MNSMTDPSSGGAAYYLAAKTLGGKAYLLAKTVGGKALMGMIGAALLYAVMPPLNKDGTFNRTEFALRLACAGTFSVVFGDWAVQLFAEFAPRLHAENHTGAVWLLTGAPGWWVSRAAALWMYRRRDKDAGQIIDEIKN
jgi:hypothetical protein